MDRKLDRLESSVTHQKSGPLSAFLERHLTSPRHRRLVSEGRVSVHTQFVKYAGENIPLGSEWELRNGDEILLFHLSKIPRAKKASLSGLGDILKDTKKVLAKGTLIEMAEHPNIQYVMIGTGSDIAGLFMKLVNSSAGDTKAEIVDFLNPNGHTASAVKFDAEDYGSGLGERVHAGFFPIVAMPAKAFLEVVKKWNFTKSGK